MRVLQLLPSSWGMWKGLEGYMTKTIIYWFGKPHVGSLQVSSPSANKGQQ